MWEWILNYIPSDVNLIIYFLQNSGVLSLHQLLVVPAWYYIDLFSLLDTSELYTVSSHFEHISPAPFWEYTEPIDQTNIKKKLVFSLKKNQK